MWHHKNEWILQWHHLVEAFPILFERQGEVLASQLQRQLFHHLGGSIQGISCQVEGKPRYEMWERFKELQRECPHHKSDWLLVQTFYNGLQQPMKISVNMATRGAFMAKSINEAKQLFEDMASNKYHWGNEWGQSKKGGRHEINAFTTLASKVDALFQKADDLQPTSSLHGSSSGVHVQVNFCQMCGIQGHTMSECHLGQLPQDVTFEQANAPHNYSVGPPNDPYSTTYNLGWRNHFNFSYKAPNPPPHHPSQGYSNPLGF